MGVVVRGLRRRRGFLAMRPGKDGGMKWCGDQPCAKDMPLGSNRIHEGWLKNRLGEEWCYLSHLPTGQGFKESRNWLFG